MNQLAGTWKLVSYERAAADGAVAYPQGENPVGRMTYDNAGRMSALLMRRDRPGAAVKSPETLRDADSAEVRGIVAGCIAYFGAYHVDEDRRTVTHDIEGCLLPGWVGTRQMRHYEVQGNRLVLSAVRESAVLRLVWEREA